MSTIEELKPVKPEPNNLRPVGQLFLYTCKQCMNRVQDPMVHSIEENHIKGYTVNVIVIEGEATPEQLEAERKAEEANRPKPNRPKV